MALRDRPESNRDNASTAATLQLAGENTSIRKEIPLPQGKGIRLRLRCASS